MKIKYLSLLLLIFLALNSYAEKPVPMYYYDGNQKIDIYMDSERFIDFSKNKDINSTLASEATFIRSLKSGVRIWQRKKTDSMARIRSTAVTNKLSEIFSYSPQNSDTVSMGLPGGVIVQFNQDWSKIQIESWLIQKGFSGRGLIPSLNMWVINTNAGIESMQIANDLYESKELVSASPNWWRNQITK